MNWTTELIEHYKNTKAVSREIKINSIIGEKSSLNPPYYRNIEGFKAPNLPFDLTEEEKEKCYYWKSNPCYIEPYISINLREYQKEILENIRNNRFTIFNTSRQIGMTLCAAIETLHYSMNNDNKNLLFLCNNSRLCIENYKSIIYYYSILPFFIKPGIKSLEEGREISFDNGSRILFDYKAEKLKVHYLILADFSYHTDDENIINTIFPVLMSGGPFARCLIYSPPNKLDDQFAKIYHYDNFFKKFEYTWNVVDNRDDRWVKNEIYAIGIDSFVREYECQFPGTKGFNRAKNLLELGVR